MRSVCHGSMLGMARTSVGDEFTCSPTRFRTKVPVFVVHDEDRLGAVRGNPSHDVGTRLGGDRLLTAVPVNPGERTWGVRTPRQIYQHPVTRDVEVPARFTFFTSDTGAPMTSRLSRSNRTPRRFPAHM